MTADGSAERPASTWRSSPASRVPARRRPARSSRTSATRSWTTCPASCCATSRSSSPTTRSATDASRSCSTCGPGNAPAGARRRAGGAPRPRHRAPDLLPRGHATRRSSGATRETRHRHPLDTEQRRRRSRRSPASARCSTTSARMAQTTIDTSDLSFTPAAGAHRRRARRRSPDPDQLVAPGHQLRLQVRRAARGRPRVRRALHGEPVLPPGAADASGLDASRSASSCSASPITRALPRASSTSFFAFADPGYHAEGKTRLTDRHRLHRRVPSLGCHRGGAGRRSCVDWTSARSASGTGSSNASVTTRRGREPRLARLRRWLRPGTRHQALAARHVPGADAPRHGRCAGSSASLFREVPGGQPRRASSSSSSSLNSCPDSLRPLRGHRRRRRHRLRRPLAPAARPARAVPGAHASRSSSSSTRSARSRAGRASSRSAAAPACRRCCAASRSSPATSPRS